MRVTKKSLEYILYFILLFVPITIFRDFTPLNELKYLSICDEMVKKGYLFILKNHGEIYGDKPPLYFWIINIEKFIFKEHTMFTIGLISVIPSFIIVLILNKWTKENLNKEENILGTLMLITTGIFMVSSFMIRMDMLMSLFITLSLFCFYRVYIGVARKIEPYLIYLFIFLAVFTKGPMGLIIPLLSIILFSIFNKKDNLVKEIKLWKGLLILLGLFTIWFGFVYHEGGKEYLYELVFKQTVNRSVNSFAHKRPFYYYLKTIIYTFAPWTLFYFYGIFDAIKNYKALEKIEKFFLIIILSTFIFLSFVSGKLDIYLLPLYCFLPFLSIMRWKKSNNKKKVLVYTTLPFILILALGMLVAPIFIKKSFNINSYSIVILIISSFSYIYAIISLMKEKYLNGVKSVYSGFALLFLFAVFNMSEINKSIGLKNIAYILSTELKNSDYDIYTYQKNEYRNIDVFIKKESELVKTSEELKLLMDDKHKKDSIVIAGTKNFKEYENKYKLSNNVKKIFSNKTFIVIKIDN